MDDYKSLAISPMKQEGRVGKSSYKPDVDIRVTEPNHPARKPKWATLSYIAAISQAILSSPMKRLPLAEIYRFIEEHHPEFKEGRPRWKNTVRHNLSLHECFVKGEMTANQKCCYWKIHPRYASRFSRGDFSRRPPDIDNGGVDYRAGHFGTAPHPTLGSDDIGQDAVGFCSWISPYALEASRRTPEDWYHPMFLPHPSAVRIYPSPIRASPHHSMLYLNGVWGKNQQLRSYEGAHYFPVK